MRSPVILILFLAIPFAACSSSPEGPGGSGRASGSAAFEQPDSAPANVSNVTGRALKAEWRNLNPKHGEQYIGLINNSSPELAQLYRNPSAYKNVKAVSDEVMGRILAGFRERDFFDLATEGRDVRSYSMGDGNGVVSLTDGDKKWALFFPIMRDAAQAQSSPVPKAYRDLKVGLVVVYNQTLWFTPSTGDDPNRTFRNPSIDRRR